MMAKNLHADECYVCIMSFIRSVLALTLALDLMPWPWPRLCWPCLRHWLEMTAIPTNISTVDAFHDINN